MAMADPAAAPYNEKTEISVLELLSQLTAACSKAPWPKKEQALLQLNSSLQQHARETQEAILCAGPTAVLDSVLSILVSERTQLSSKLLAADVLSCMCSGAKACLLLCPSSIVERLMRCAYKGDADVKAAAARALWQLSCVNDFSPEVVSHAGNAFKVVELLAQDIQGGSSTCMCALRATQNLLHTYATSAAGDAGERIGGRMVEPLCNLLDSQQPEAAAAAAELLALLAQTGPNRARIVAAGGIPRLVALMGYASSSTNSSSGLAGASPYSLLASTSSSSSIVPGVNKAELDNHPASTGGAMSAASSAATSASSPVSLQEAAAQAALQALAQLTRGDAKLCAELLSAQVMPALLQLLCSRGCCAAALALIGDLAALPEGRRALHYADGFAALSQVAEDCPEQQLCRLLSKLTKGCPPGSQDLAALVANPHLVAVLVRCCSPADRKTCKRALQVLGRLLEHSKAAGTLLQLQQQLLSHGLLHQILTVLSLPHQQQHKSGPAPGTSDGSSSSQGNVLEVQLAVALLQEVATCSDMLSAAAAAAGGSKVAPEIGTQAAVMPIHQQQQQQDHQSSHDQSNKQQQASALSMQLAAASTAAAAAGPCAAVADAIMATPSFVWKYPAAAAAAFGDMTRLLPGLTSSSSSEQAGASAGCQKQQQQQQSSLLPSLLWQLQQLLLSPAHQLPSLQQQVLQVVSDVAAHKQPALLECMVQQGWVQVLWSFLPGGRQLLAVTLSQLIQQQQQVVSSQAPAGAAITQQQQQQAQMQNLRSPSSIHTKVGSRGSSLQPHLLQLLDESLPSLEQTQHALQALAHLCSWPTAAAVAVQLQASYQAASSSGMLAMRAAGVQTGTPTAAAASHGAAAAVAAMLFGVNTASPKAGAGLGASSKTAFQGALGAQASSSSQPQSPKVYVPNTPLSSSSCSSSMESSFVSVTGSLPVSSSLSASSGSLGVSSSGGSAGSGSGGSIIRSSSSGLLSRLGMGRSGAQQRAQAAAADAAAAAGSSSSSRATAAGGSEVAGAAAKHAAAAAAAGEPVEDPGSPVWMLVTLLGEQWAATAAAELLAHLAAAGPTTCLPAMLEQGVVSTLAGCMAEIQPNSAGAVAALATLLLVQQLGKHWPEQLHAAGIVTTVLSMLKFDCGDAATAAPVRAAALQVLAVLCSGDGSRVDRQLCAAVAQAALLQLVRWLGSDKDSAETAAAAAALTGLLECGAVDAAALAALRDGEQRSELLSRCLACLQYHGMQQHQDSADAPADAEQGQQQLLVQLTAVRLLRAFVELDGRMVEAFLAADGLAQIVPILSAAVSAAANSTVTTTVSSSSSSLSAVERRKLVLQYELLAVLDSLSLVHRRVLVQAAIVPIIVGVLRQHLPQQHQDAQDAASNATNTTGPPAAAAPGQTSAGAASGSAAGAVGMPAKAAGRPISASAATAAGAAGAAAAGPGSAAAASSRSMTAGSSRQRSKSLTRSSSRAPGAAAGVSACGMPDAELLLRCKVIACQLITVLAINNDVKRQLFHSDAVGPLMQLAEAVSEGSPAQDAIRAALAQLGLVYLLPAPPAAAVGGSSD